MKAAAEAIIELARNSSYVGGTVGVLAVLHTWTQQLLYHPHVHCDLPLRDLCRVFPDLRCSPTSWGPGPRGSFDPCRECADQGI